MELTCQGKIARRPMIDIIMGHRTEDGVMFGKLGESRHVLADSDARHRGGNVAKSTAHFFWRVGLGIPSFVLALAAATKDDQDGFRSGPGPKIGE